jgi:hypothetical protein
MNDSTQPPKRTQAIARALAPYFHPKLKPVEYQEGLFASTSAADEKATEGDAASLLREQIRKTIFNGGY